LMTPQVSSILSLIEMKKIKKTDNVTHAKCKESYEKFKTLRNLRERYIHLFNTDKRIDRENYDNLKYDSYFKGLILQAIKD